MNPSRIKLLLSLVAFTLTFSACSSNQSDQTNSQAEAEQAPDFEVTTIDGETISLESSLDEGKPVVIYFTASWCPICAQNWPVLSEVYPEFEDQLTLVAISIDPTDDVETMRALAEEKNFQFPSTHGIPEIMLNYNVDSQATTVGVNRDGNIEFRRNKTALSADEYRELFTRLVE